MNNPLVVLGATGSIGTQTLEVADALEIAVAALVAKSPSPQLADIVSRYPDANVVVVGGSVDEREQFARTVPNRVEFGAEAVLEVCGMADKTVVNGIVGAAGLGATVAALSAGNRVALANKESLVAGGPVVKRMLAEGTGVLIPVDSEHSALYQCLVGESMSEVSRLILTASGGPFRGRARDSLAEVTPEEALRHPTWDMGRRVTIDSATMFNKGLEIIEAHYLFNAGYDTIDVVIHPQSILHSAVEFVDGSWKGHIGHPDMRIPIQYAITAPNRAPRIASPFDLAGIELSFEVPDRQAFPALDIAYAAGRAGGSAPAAMNAADEVAVDAFLQRRLGFVGISEIVEQTIDRVEWRDLATVEDVAAVDQEARSIASSLISGVSW